MNRYKRMALKALSYCGNNLKKNYKIYRKFTNAVRVCTRHGCKVTDREVVAGGRKVPVRFFLSQKKANFRYSDFFSWRRVGDRKY